MSIFITLSGSTSVKAARKILVKLTPGGLVSIYTSATAASKNNAKFKSSLNQLKNNHLNLLI